MNSKLAYRYLYIHTHTQIVKNCFMQIKKIYIYILVLANDLSRLIASKIIVFVYIIYECVLCIFIMYKYKHMHVFKKNMFIY